LNERVFHWEKGRLKEQKKRREKSNDEMEKEVREKRGWAGKCYPKKKNPKNCGG